MAFCPNCGAEAEGRYCAKCGASLEAASSAEGGTGAAPGTQPVAGGLQENVAGALCYVLGLITGILFLVLEPYSRNKNIRFHAFQSIFLHVAILIVFFVIAAMFGPLGAFLAPLIGLASFVLWIFMIYKTYMRQTVVLPLIGPLAQKQA